MLTLLGFAAAILGSSAAIGANRCVDGKGRVTYQDAACDVTTTSRTVDTSDAFSARPGRSAPVGGLSSAGGDGSAYRTTGGAWRGPAQLFLRIGQQAHDPTGVTPMVLELKRDGEVAGVIGQYGCKLSGLSTQMVVPTVASLGVTVSGCPDPRFNGRYTGQLGAYSATREATLNLSTFIMLPGNTLQQMRISAVMKR